MYRWTIKENAQKVKVLIDVKRQRPARLFLCMVILLWTVPAWAKTAAPKPSERAVEMQQLLVMDLNHSEDVKPDVAQTLTDLITTNLSQQKEFRTLSGDDIRKLLEIEGKKQALGCDEGDSCIEEIAGAMGARFVVYGRISKLDDLLLLQINLFDAHEGMPVSRRILEADSLAAFAHLIPEEMTEFSSDLKSILRGEGKLAPISTLSKNTKQPAEKQRGDEQQKSKDDGTGAKPIEKAQSEQAPTQEVETQVREASWLSKHIPLLYFRVLWNKDLLEPEVADNFWSLLALGAVLGPVNGLIPRLALPGDTEIHGDFMSEQLLGGVIATPFYNPQFGPISIAVGMYLNAFGFVSRLDRNIKKSRGKPPTEF